jgi:hypothetical protein
MTQEEVRLAQEHRDVLLAIKTELTTVSGRIFFKYLFKSLGVGELPELGLEGNLLMDKLGFLRAGNAVFNLVAQADPSWAARLLAEIQKERNDELFEQAPNFNE